MNKVPVNSIGQISLEYAAGFIDADGCITHYVDYNGKRRWEVNAVQCERNGLEPLYALQARWGGSVCGGKPPKKEHYSPIWKWAVKGIEAAVVMWDLHPYFVIKKERCEQGLIYFNEKEPKVARILSRLKEPRP
jgi:hypothetical protein